MKCLNIRSTYAQIGQHTEQGKMDTEAPLPRTYIGDKEPYKLDIHTTQLRIEFDLTDFWNSIGKMEWKTFEKKQSSIAKQKATEGTERRAREGRELMEAGGRDHKVISRQSLAYANTIPDDKTIILTMPAPPKFNVILGEYQNNTEYGKARVDADLKPVETNYQPMETETYLKQKQDIRMWVTDGKYDIYA